MKHQEAAKFTCPQSLVAGKPSPCLGGNCAAWRWAEPKWGAVEQRRGYCGLAGEIKYPLNPANEQQS